MQVGKTRAIEVDLEHRAIKRTAAIMRRPIQGVARYNQSGKRGRSVGAASEIMKVCEVLGRHPASQYQPETSDQRRNKTLNVVFCHAVSFSISWVISVCFPHAPPSLRLSLRWFCGSIE